VSGSQIPRTPNIFVVHCMNQSLCDPEARHYLLQRCGESVAWMLGVSTLPNGRLGMWHIIGFREEAKGTFSSGTCAPPRRPLGTVCCVCRGNSSTPVARVGCCVAPEASVARVTAQPLCMYSSRPRPVSPTINRGSTFLPPLPSSS
jgi:hypothetical protein